MPLIRPPKVGAVVLCVFPDAFVAPEMVKTRPVAIISPRIPGRHALATLVPLSTAEPTPMHPHHCEIPVRLMPKSLRSEATRVWAKCDMLYTLSLDRLDRFKAGRDRATGKRLFEIGQLEIEQILAIRRGIAAGLGITHATLLPPR